MGRRDLKGANESKNEDSKKKERVILSIGIWNIRV